MTTETINKRKPDYYVLIQQPGETRRKCIGVAYRHKNGPGVTFTISDINFLDNGNLRLSPVRKEGA